MKYNITVAKIKYGDIEIRANNRKEAKEEAINEKNRDKIKWHENDSYNVAEVYEMEECCPKCGVKLPDNSVYCYQCGEKIF